MMSATKAALIILVTLVNPLNNIQAKVHRNIVLNIKRRLCKTFSIFLNPT